MIAGGGNGAGRVASPGLPLRAPIPHPAKWLMKGGPRQDWYASPAFAPFPKREGRPADEDGLIGMGQAERVVFCRVESKFKLRGYHVRPAFAASLSPRNPNQDARASPHKYNEWTTLEKAREPPCNTGGGESGE